MNHLLFGWQFNVTEVKSLFQKGLIQTNPKVMLVLELFHLVVAKIHGSYALTLAQMFLIKLNLLLVNPHLIILKHILKEHQKKGTP